MFLLFLADVQAGDATSSHKEISTCPPASAHVLLADAQAAIYTVRERLIEHIEGRRKASSIIATRGCDASSKRSFRLDWEFANAGSAESRSPIPPRLRLGGSFVAYEESSSTATRYTREGEPVSSTWRVIVRDLKNGRVLHNAPTGVTSPPNPHFVGDGPTTMIVVKDNGAVAWITDTVQSENRYQVHALDKTGERTLAVGSSIDPNSLALVGGTLYWTQGGQPVSAPLQ